jgi:hypothetical protein
MKAIRYVLELTLRTAMLGPEPSFPLASGLLETPHPTPKTNIEAVVILYLWWMLRRVEQTVT